MSQLVTRDLASPPALTPASSAFGTSDYLKCILEGRPYPEPLRCRTAMAKQASATAGEFAWVLGAPAAEPR